MNPNNNPNNNNPPNSSDKKTICTLCQEVRELVKYIDNVNIKPVLHLIDEIQDRAYNMEKGLFKSKYMVGGEILDLLIKSDTLNKEELTKIISNRWPTLKN